MTQIEIQNGYTAQSVDNNKNTTIPTAEIIKDEIVVRNQPEIRQEMIEDLDLTPIQQFYDGANIFVTGSTGFLGKILVEKLLRSCPTISTIYLLIRNKKGKNMETRVEEIFDDVLFSVVLQQYPKIRHKVVGISGDCSLPGLGLSIQDRQLLIQETTVVFHVAATVRFDEKLKHAVAINVRGPHDVLELCKQMKNLKSCVHVSTAYSNCPSNVIEEKFYSTPIDSKKLMLLVETLPDKIVEHVTPTVIDNWPNTYAFTKAVAEDVIKQEANVLPLGIFRPAIVISTYKEPIHGWINNLYGPTGVCAGAGTGLLRTLRADSNVNANIVPVDMCCNALIASAWEVNKKYLKATEEQTNYEIPIYHYESSNHSPINWGRYMKLAEENGLIYPSIKAIWYYSLTLHSSTIGYWLSIILLHYFPALISDLVLICIGKKPKLFAVYKKVHKFTDVIAYFSTRNFKFQSSRVQQMIETMSDEDKKIFFCDLKQLDWDDYFKEYILGIREYLLQDPIDTLPEAHIKWNRLYWCHQILKLIAGLLTLKLIWSLISYVFSSFF